MILSAGPYSIPVGESITVAFAFIGGYTLSDIQQSAQAAVERWQFISNAIFDESIPFQKAFKLFQNYPNPFNSFTILNFQLPFDDHVRIKIYDMLGKEVTTIVDEKLSAGIYRKVWDASNLPSGVYFYKMQSESFKDTKRLILIK